MKQKDQLLGAFGEWVSDIECVVVLQQFIEEFVKVMPNVLLEAQIDRRGVGFISVLSFVSAAYPARK